MKNYNPDENTKRINRVLRTIRGVDQLIVREKDKIKLLKGVCETLTENRSYYNAWIVLWDENGNVIATAESGIEKDFLMMMESMKDAAKIDCVISALHHSGIVLTVDPFSECQNCPLSNTYAGRGAMTMQLKHADKVMGIICVSIPKEFIADTEEHELFSEIVADVSFSLNAIDMADEQKLIKNQIAENEKQFRTLVENSLAGISIIQNSQVVFQNKEQERLFGSTPRSTILAGIQHIHSDDVDKVKRFYQTIRKKKFKPIDTDFRFYPIQAGERMASMKWIYCRACPINYKGTDSVLLNAVDLTEFKELERLLQVQDKMASLGRVAAGIAHEIRNPLSGINIYLNTLERIYAKTGGAEKIDQILTQLKSASRKIESVIKRVMDFSKPGNPRFVLTDMNKPVEAAIALSSAMLRKSAIRIEKELAEDLPDCYLDPHLIEEVILNLINNAVEAMSHMTTGKSIRLVSCYRHNTIRLTICDSGPGISDALRDKIFEPYFTTKSSGTGIGLNLCQRVVVDHGGTLKAATSDSGGAEFTIDIPVKKGVGSR